MLFDVSKWKIFECKLFGIISSLLSNHIKPQIIPISSSIDIFIYGPSQIYWSKTLSTNQVDFEPPKFILNHPSQLSTIQKQKQKQNNQKKHHKILTIETCKSFKCLDFDGFNCCSRKIPYFMLIECKLYLLLPVIWISSIVHEFFGLERYVPMMTYMFSLLLNFFFHM